MWVDSSVVDILWALCKKSYHVSIGYAYLDSLHVSVCCPSDDGSRDPQRFRKDSFQCSFIFLWGSFDVAWKSPPPLSLSLHPPPSPLIFFLLLLRLGWRGRLVRNSIGLSKSPDLFFGICNIPGDCFGMSLNVPRGLWGMLLIFCGILFKSLN